VPVNSSDEKAILIYKNGKQSVRSINYGESFLSSGGRFVNVDKNVKQIVLINTKGDKKTIDF
jgi:hypothetical protein